MTAPGAGGTTLLPGRVGLGTAALGGLYRPVPAPTARQTLTAAWQCGVRLFDTAPHYGVGLAEERLGEFLSGHPGAVISTKVGRLLVDDLSASTEAEGFVGTPRRRRQWDFTRDGIRRSLDDSLARTRIDRFDIVFLHDPDVAIAADPRHERDILDEALPTLAELRSEGVIRAFGVGMNDAEELTRFVLEADLDVVLIAGRLTLLDQSAARSLLPTTRTRGTQVLVGGVFNSGVLAVPDGNFDYAPPSAQVQERVSRLRRICAEFGVDLAAAAVQYPLRQQGVDAVLLGPRTPLELKAGMQLLGANLPDTLWAELDAAGAPLCV